MKCEVWPLLDINTFTTSELAPAWREINYFSWNFLTDWEPRTFSQDVRRREVTCAGHGDDGPVQGLGQRVEHRVRLVLLQGVAQPGEYQHPHADRHTEQQQLPVAVPQCGPQGLQSSDMSRQLEYPQDPQYSEYLRSLGDIFQ